MNYIPSTLAAWVLIVASGVFEILFAVQMKESNGFRNPAPSTIAIVAALISIWLMTLSLRTLPLGISYAVWAGIGTVGTVIAAVLLYSEDITLLKATFMALIVIGIIGLQIHGGSS